ncbi:MAG: D-alanyl-D-alanine carboxypeptidase, partial [Burkholderiales bacterium]
EIRSLRDRPEPLRITARSLARRRAAGDGTVEQRCQDGSVAGQALLKTGSLEGVRALAGYVIDASGTRWIVVAIVNDPRAARARPARDARVQRTYANAAAAAKAAR